MPWIVILIKPAIILSFKSERCARCLHHRCDMLDIAIAKGEFCACGEQTKEKNLTIWRGHKRFVLGNYFLEI